jgi:ribonuclease Z
MFCVEFIGVGDATDFESGQSSVLYRGSCRLLIDCGPAVPAALARRRTSADELDGIYLTHGHADHCFGLPSMLLWLRQRQRTRPLALLGHRDALRTARTLLELGYPGAFVPSKCFAIEEVALGVEHSQSWHGVELTIAPTEHNVPNYAVRIADQGAVFAMSGDGRFRTGKRALFWGTLVSSRVRLSRARESQPRKCARFDGIGAVGPTSSPRCGALQ